MKCFVSLFFLFQISFIQAQNIEIKFVKSFLLEVDQFIGVDNFDNLYFIKDQTLFKKTELETFSYTNNKYGSISSVDISNPLKILIFYKDFNTVLFLDNNLNELTTSINFLNENLVDNVSFANISSNNNLWLFSLDDNKLKLWNLKTKNTIFISQPLSYYRSNFKPLKQMSSYKYCWVIGENGALKFNEYGTFVEGKKIENTDDLTPFKNGYIYLNNSKLNYWDSSDKNHLLEIGTDVIIKTYKVNSDHIYIFDGTQIFVYKFIKN
jgi:WD40 repeat protein